MTPRQTLAKIRKLLASTERDDIKQGVEIAATLEDPEILATLAGGIAIDAEGRLSWARPSEVSRRVHREHRDWAALAFARAGGLLDDVEVLDLRPVELSDDLSPLRDLTELRTLWVASKPGLDAASIATLTGLEELELELLAGEDAAPLTALSGLRRLTIAHVANDAAWRALSEMRGLETLEVNDGWVSDLVPLAGMHALRELTLLVQGARDLSPLSGLASMRRLTLPTWHASDLSPLSGLTGLVELSLPSLGAADLSPLAALTGLEVLELPRARELTDLSPLASLTRLRRLSLSGCTALTALPPMPGLAALAQLRLDGCHALTDLSGVRALPALAALDISDCKALRDLSPLEGLTGLRGLEVDSDFDADDVGPLRGLAGVAAGFAVDGEGWLAYADPPPPGAHAGERLSPAASRLAVLIDGPHLAGVRHLSLRRQGNLCDLNALAACVSLESLNVEQCWALRDVYGIAGLERLAHLEAEYTRVDPPPQPRSLVGRAKLARYQRKLLRSLSELPARSPVQEAILAATAGAARPTAPTIDKRARTRMRRALASSRPAERRQGFAEMMSGDFPAEVSELAEGISLDPDGRIVVSPAAARRPHLSKGNRRLWNALALLRAAGRLDAVERLDLTTSTSLLDLSPLAGLDALQELRLRARDVGDLSPLRGLPALRRLDLYRCYAVSDLSPLLGMPALEWLDLRGCGQLPKAQRKVYDGAEAIAELWRV